MPRQVDGPGSLVETPATTEVASPPLGAIGKQLPGKTAAHRTAYADITPLGTRAQAKKRKEHIRALKGTQRGIDLHAGAVARNV